MKVCYRKTSLCALFLALSFASQLQAQKVDLLALDDPARDKPVMTFKAHTKEVAVPVSVHDKKGKIITTLSLSDFQLTEDGRPQTLKSFNNTNSEPLLVGMLCDTSASMSSALESERKAANSFVDQILPEDPESTKDQLFLLHFDSEVEVLQGITRARYRLHGAIDKLTGARGSAHSDQSQAGSGEGSGKGDGNIDPVCGCEGGTHLYDAIYSTAEQMGGVIDRRQAIIVFSDGMDQGSKRTIRDAVVAAERAQLAIYTIYFVGDNPGHTAASNISDSNADISQGLRASSVSFPKPSSSVDGKKVMETLADLTGGIFYQARNKNELEMIYKKIAEELRHQYILTYTPDKEDKNGNYHKIAIKTTDSKLRTSARDGYYADYGR